jgi:hypothetical protein
MVQEILILQDLQIKNNKTEKGGNQQRWLASGRASDRVLVGWI